MGRSDGAALGFVDSLDNNRRVNSDDNYAERGRGLPVGAIRARKKFQPLGQIKGWNRQVMVTHTLRLHKTSKIIASRQVLHGSDALRAPAIPMEGPVNCGGKVCVDGPKDVGLTVVRSNPSAVP